jgi:hypothetical protein
VVEIEMHLLHQEVKVDAAAMPPGEHLVLIKVTRDRMMRNRAYFKHSNIKINSQLNN